MGAEPQGYKKANSGKGFEFDEWNGDRMSELILSSFLREDLLPKSFQSRQDLVNFIQMFKRNRGNVIASFDNIIDNPNRQFIFYAESIPMEQFLEKVVLHIHEDALNLEYNYNELKKLQTVVQN